MPRIHQYGFTLAELLIALAILGVIATFTIPKILSAQQSSQFRSVGKEAAAMVSAAYHLLQISRGTDAATTVDDLTPYLNYVAVDTTSVIDNDFISTTKSCAGAGVVCLRLHSGAMLRYQQGANFGGTSTLDALWFAVDPDGRVTTSGAAGTPGKEQDFILYFNGSIRDCKNALAGTSYYYTGECPDPSREADWFDWN
jgi:prepilin-type N-terminal cleavage/methylation domain-containing protein